MPPPTPPTGHFVCVCVWGGGPPSQKNCRKEKFGGFYELSINIFQITAVFLHVTLLYHSLWIYKGHTDIIDDNASAKYLQNMTTWNMINNMIKKNYCIRKGKNKSYLILFMYTIKLRNVKKVYINKRNVWISIK